MSEEFKLIWKVFCSPKTMMLLAEALLTANYTLRSSFFKQPVVRKFPHNWMVLPSPRPNQNDLFSHLANQRDGPKNEDKYDCTLYCWCCSRRRLPERASFRKTLPIYTNGRGNVVFKDKFNGSVHPWRDLSSCVSGKKARPRFAQMFYHLSSSHTQFPAYRVELTMACTVEKMKEDDPPVV